MGGAGLTPLDNSGLTPLDAAGLTPLDAAGLTPLDDSGLMPLDDLGLMPLGTDMELAPLSPAAGLTPLDAAPGLTPLDDPFAELGDPGNPFASPLGGGGLATAGNPYQSPAVLSGSRPGRSRRSGGFSFLDVVSCTWYTFWDNWASCLLLSLMLIGLYLGLGVVVGIVLPALQLILRIATFVPELAKAIVGFVVLLGMLGMLLLAAFTIQAGVIRITVDMVKGKAYSFGDLVQQGNYALRLLAAAIVQNLIGLCVGLMVGVAVGGVIFLVGSQALAMVAYVVGMGLNVLVSVLLLLTPYMIVDQDSGVFDAISESVGTMKDKILVTIALMLTMGIALAAFVVLTLGLGLLLAGPFFLIFLAALYAKAAEQRTAY